MFLYGGGVLLDPSKVALPLTVTHGRIDVGTQPEAPTMSFEYWDPVCPFGLGDEVRMETAPDRLSLPTVTWNSPIVTWNSPLFDWNGGLALSTAPETRFVGRVTGLGAVEALGDVVAWKVEATGRLASLGRVDIMRPAESDVDRVQAIAIAAGFNINVAGTSALTLRADTITRDALSALHEVCASSGGLLWQDRDGEVWYGTSNHRANIPPEHHLFAWIIEDGVAWAQTEAPIINHVVVTFGPDPDTRTQNTYSDPDSIARWGRRTAEVDTLLEDENGADALGAAILARRKDPYWVSPGPLVLPTDGGEAETLAVNALRVGDPVLVPIPPEPGKTGRPYTWTVEGWQEVYATPGVQELTVALSDRERWGASGLRSWATVAQDTWAHWAAGTWFNMMVEV